MADNTQFDSESYAKLRPHFQHAMEQFIEAGHSVREFVDFIIEKFDDTILPYLKRFLAEIEQGTVVIDNLSRSASSTLFGRNTSPELRRQMIEQAAYFRAQQRGFVGCDPVADWIEAEREVDTELESETGLIARGHQAIVTLSSAVEKELIEVINSISQWLKGPQAH